MNPPFQKDDKVLIRTRMRKGEEEYEAYIHDVEEKDDSWYFHFIPLDVRHGMWGCAKLYKNGPNEWGVQAVTVIGKRDKHNDFATCHWQPEPGNPGYDLMH